MHIYDEFPEPDEAMTRIEREINPPWLCSRLHSQIKYENGERDCESEREK